MSGHWIQLGDTRVNVAAQAKGLEILPVIDATVRLFAVHTLPADSDDEESAP